MASTIMSSHHEMNIEQVQQNLNMGEVSGYGIHIDEYVHKKTILTYEQVITQRFADHLVQSGPKCMYDYVLASAAVWHLKMKVQPQEILFEETGATHPAHVRFRCKLLVK